MKKDLIVAIGTPYFDLETLKAPDVFITNIDINILQGIVNITFEKGLKVSRVNLTLNEAQSIGFLNKKALIPYLK